MPLKSITNIPFILAPMAEISHRPLRELIEGFNREASSPGCDEYFTEMLSAGALLGGGPFEKWYLDPLPCPERLVYQLAGRDRDQLAKAAALLDRRDCLGIDLNMGCSAPLIVRSGAGVRWMEDIDRAGELIRLVRRGVKKRLSVKLRTGFENDAGYLLRFCRRLEEEGVDMITLHPRTAGEKFRRRSRWEYVGLLRGELKIPVTGNGDIGGPAELLGKTAECDGVMVGRAAVRRPWIFAEARRLAHPGPEGGGGFGPVNLEETGLRFLDLLSQYQPPEFHLSRARRFFGYFCDNLMFGHYAKTLIFREKDLPGMGRAWTARFAGTGEPVRVYGGG